MSYRSITLVSIVGVLLLVSACTFQSITPVVPTPVTESSATPTALAAKAACPPTQPIFGFNYVWNSPVRSSVGEGHLLSGVVRSSVDCSPIANAKLEFWLAGPDGQYDDAHRATLFADGDGIYHFESNFPGRYPERPEPHIHLFISASGYGGLMTEYHPVQGQTKSALDIVLAPDDLASLLPERPLSNMSGRIAFHTQREGAMEIYAVNVDGSELTNLTKSEAEEMFPVWSPDGRKIAFVSNQTGNPDIYVMDADGANVTNITQHPAEDVDHAWSPDGMQLIIASNRDGDWELYLMQVGSNTLTQITENTIEDWSPTWSPDGTQIAFSSAADIWLMNADGSELRNLTNHQADDDMPSWSPDGTRLVFASTRNGDWELYTMNVDGAELQRLTNLPSEDTFPMWSPDGMRIAFKSDRDGNPEIYVMNADGSGVTRVTDDPAGDGFPHWQPKADDE